MKMQIFRQIMYSLKGHQRSNKTTCMLWRSVVIFYFKTFLQPCLAFLFTTFVLVPNPKELQTHALQYNHVKSGVH